MNRNDCICIAGWQLVGHALNKSFWSSFLHYSEYQFRILIAVYVSILYTRYFVRLNFTCITLGEPGAALEKAFYLPALFLTRNRQ